MGENAKIRHFLGKNRVMVLAQKSGTGTHGAFSGIGTTQSGTGTSQSGTGIIASCNPIFAYFFHR